MIALRGGLSIPAAAVIVVMAGCASTLPTDYPMTAEPIPAYNGAFQAYIPSGWILRPDSLGVMRLHGAEGEMVVTAFGLDSVTALEVHRQGLPLLAEIAAGLRAGAPAGTRGAAAGGVPEYGEPFTLGGKECGAYEIRSKSSTIRGVVFQLGGTYYECEAARTGAPDADLDEKLYTAQNSFIALLR